MNFELQDIHSEANSVTTYQEAMADIIELLRGIAPNQWESPTPCPGWTVADIAAHLIDLDAMVVNRAAVEHEPVWDSLPHVKTGSSRFTERGVDFRRGTSSTDLLEQMTSTSQALIEHLPVHGLEFQVPWMKGEISIDQFLSLRTFDIWVHEQDIRSALGMPGNLGNNPARTSAQRMISALPLIWGKKVGAPPGSVITLHLTGPEIIGAATIMVNHDGRAVFTELTESAGDVYSDVNSVSMSWPSFNDAFCGRVELDAIVASADLVGPLAEAFVSQLPSTP
jgi:uncharacterized protein (TIGR03083 family)